jgi:hypothetical protein
MMTSVQSCQIICWVLAYFLKDFHIKISLYLYLNVTFYIARNNVRHAAIQYILDSAILALDENPDRRFIYVEMAFFWRWWNQQTEDMRNKVRQFVNEGNFCLLIIFQ